MFNNTCILYLYRWWVLFSIKFRDITPTFVLAAFYFMPLSSRKNIAAGKGKRAEFRAVLTSDLYISGSSYGLSRPLTFIRPAFGNFYDLWKFKFSFKIVYSLRSTAVLSSETSVPIRTPCTVCFFHRRNPSSDITRELNYYFPPFLLSRFSLSPWVILPLNFSSDESVR